MFEVEFDAAKDAANLAKHRVGLDLVTRFNEATMRYVGARKVGAEERLQLLGQVDGCWYVAVVTPRPPRVRVISVRRASRKERKRYGEA